MSELSERESTEVVQAAFESLTTEPELNSESIPTQERPKSLRQSLKSNIEAPDGIAKEIADKVDAKQHAKENGIEAPIAPVAEVQAPTPSIPAPSDMSKEEQEVFAKLDPASQQYLARRAYETRNYLTQQAMKISEKERELGDVYSVVTPEIRDQYAREGIAVPDLVRRSLAWDRAFKNDKYGAAREYLDAYGVDINQLLQTQQNQPQNYLTREEAEQLAQERIAHEFEMREQQNVAAQNFNVVQSFINSKPLFKDPNTASQLEAEMAPVVAGLRSQNPGAPVDQLLETAYSYVTKGNPLFSTLTNQLAAKQGLDQKAAEAQRAKAASRSISGGPGSGSPKLNINNLRENLRVRYNGAA